MRKNQIIFLFILVLGIGIFFRIWQLDSIPPGLYPDEAINANDAITALETNQYKLFYPENNGREGFFINLIAFIFKIFGIHIWSLKLVSALIGILTIIGLYLLTKELFKRQGKIIALLSSFFLATSFWHINFSRISFRAILVPFCLVWSFYFLFKLINSQNKKTNIFLSVIYSVLAGFFFGLGFHTYIAFRTAIIILIIPIIIILLRFWKEYKTNNRLWFTYFKKGFWQYDLWILVIIITALPMGLYFLQNPQDFLGRAGGVSVFAQENPLKALAESIVKTLGMFNFVGDKNWRHNFSGSPQLFWPIGILFLIGLIFSIKKLIKSIKEKRSSSFIVHCSLLAWFVVMLLPAIFTAEGLPHALRSIGVIPVCYIFAGLGAYMLYKFLYKLTEFKKIKKSLFFLVCIVFLLACGYIQYNKYFIDWAKNPEVEGAFAKNYVEIGKYLNDLPLETESYIIVNQSGVMIPIQQNGEIKKIPMPAQTIIFVENAKGKRQKAKYLLSEEIDKIEPADKLIVIPLQYDIEIFKKLKEKFPEGEIKPYKNFWLFEI